MATVSQTSGDMLVRLGRRLRLIRLERHETKAQFAARLKISPATLRSLENGRPGMSIGQWAAVFENLNRLDELDLLLASQARQAPYEHQTRQRRMRPRFATPASR